MSIDACTFRAFGSMTSSLRLRSHTAYNVPLASTFSPCGAIAGDTSMVPVCFRVVRSTTAMMCPGFGLLP